MRYVSDKHCRENRNTHFVFSNVFFLENHAAYDIMWENNVERGRPQMAIWRMRIACWILKATNTHTHTHRLCNTQRFSTATMFARRATVSLYTYIVCPVGVSVVFPNDDGRQNTSEYSLTI